MLSFIFPILDTLSIIIILIIIINVIIIIITNFDLYYTSSS